MSLADDMFDSAMSIYRQSGARAARYDLATSYDLLQQDRRLNRISEEEFQRSKAVIVEVRDRLETLIDHAEGRNPISAVIEPRAVAGADS